MTTEEIATIQEEANRLVFEGRAVHVEVEELDREKIPEVPKLDSGRNVGKGLPSDYTGGVKRTVIIDGIDRSPCVSLLDIQTQLVGSVLTHIQMLRNAHADDA